MSNTVKKSAIFVTFTELEADKSRSELAASVTMPIEKFKRYQLTIEELANLLFKATQNNSGWNNDCLDRSKKIYSEMNIDT